MKNQWLVALFCCAFSVSFGQNADQNVISTAGETFSTPSIQLSYTLGEAISETFVSDSSQLTQGFHQGSFIIVSVDEKRAETDTRFQFYPNPFSDQVTLTIEKTNLVELDYTLQIFNLQGQLVYSTSIQASTTRLNLGELASANYFIYLVNNQSQEKQSYKIIKNQ